MERWKDGKLKVTLKKVAGSAACGLRVTESVYELRLRKLKTMGERGISGSSPQRMNRVRPRDLELARRDATRRYTIGSDASKAIPFPGQQLLEVPSLSHVTMHFILGRITLRLHTTKNNTEY